MLGEPKQLWPPGETGIVVEPRPGRVNFPGYYTQRPITRSKIGNIGHGTNGSGTDAGKTTLTTSQEQFDAWMVAHISNRTSGK
jgi:hypothetical protein